jgi:PEP-CTERM motif
VKFTSLVACLVFTCANSMSFAATPVSVSITNAGFAYVPALTPGSWTTLPGGTGIATTTPIQGWDVFGPDTGSHTTQDGYYNSPYVDGTVAYIGGSSEVLGSFSQVLGTTQAGTYEVAIDVGWRNGLVFAGYSLSLSANGTSFASSTNEVSFSAADQGTFKRVSLVSVVDPGSSLVGQALTLTVAAASPGRFTQTNFDNVSVTLTPVPEPAASILLTVGLGLLFFAKRKVGA